MKEFGNTFYRLAVVLIMSSVIALGCSSDKEGNGSEAADSAVPDGDAAVAPDSDGADADIAAPMPDVDPMPDAELVPDSDSAAPQEDAAPAAAPDADAAPAPDVQVDSGSQG